MRNAAIILFVVAAGLGVFGYWGINSAAGRKRYDEMAGMIPYFALIAAVVILLVGVALLIYSLMSSSPKA